MKRILPLAAVALLTVVLPTLADDAKRTPRKLSAATIGGIETAVRKEMAERKIPGMTVAVAVGNRLCFEKAFGLADLEHRVPCKTETLFRTASIAKPMTAVAVMQLAERGKLDLDAPIRKYCPEFPEKKWPVTVRQLLGHLGGIRHYKNGLEAAGTGHFPDLKSTLRLFQNDPLKHEPGTKFLYTTYGFTLLGRAVETASGMSYDEYMRKHVFGPAGMKHTGIDHTRLILPHRARGYSRLSPAIYKLLPAAEKKLLKPGEVYNAMLHDTSMKVPGGGIVSTSADLVRFACAVNMHRLVKVETRDQMWTRQKTRDGKPTRYGLGWAVGTAEKTRVIAHGGGQAGTSTYLVLFPEKGIVVAVMCNLDRTSPKNLATRIATDVLKSESR